MSTRTLTLSIPAIELPIATPTTATVLAIGSSSVVASASFSLPR
jgi:hypothetical protein